MLWTISLSFVADLNSFWWRFPKCTFPHFLMVFMVSKYSQYFDVPSIPKVKQ